VENKWEYNGTLHQTSIHFKKAYDSVKREVLYNVLTEFGKPRKLAGVIKLCLVQYSTYRQKSVQISCSEWSEIRDALLPLLFTSTAE
jgi:hypothetical protein